MSGIKPVRLLFRSARGEPDGYWEVSFPGCKPSFCNDMALELNFTKVNREFWLTFAAASPLTRVETVELVRDSSGGSEKIAWLEVSISGRDRVISYRVLKQIEPETRIGRILSILQRQSHEPLLTEILESRNLALDVMN